ncbi:MAG: sensor histidine kinase [Bacteroidota bacterium]
MVKSMGFLRKNYKAFLTGGLITIGMTIMFSQVEDFHLINPKYFSRLTFIAVNILAITFIWWGISVLITRWPIYMILGLLGLLTIVNIIEEYTRTPENPVSIPLLILFWLGLAYLIIPQFFSKYRIAILSVYGAVISYFLIFRMLPNYMEDHHKTFLNFMLIPLPVFGVLWGYEQWRSMKVLQADKVKAELSLLKTQINPHFFFNTLNNLYGLAVEKSDQAPAMILKLSDMMRYTIYEGKADYVALEDEVAYLEDYIELHKIRYQKKVDISFQKDLRYAHEIAPLLLIVPLENAFKHGVESLAADAFIDVNLQTSPSGISFSISNNYESNPQEREGIGLANLKKRLALIYPHQHQLKMTKTGDTYTVNLEIESV